MDLLAQIVEDANRGLALRPDLKLIRNGYIRNDEQGRPCGVCAVTACYLGHHQGQLPSNTLSGPFDNRPAQILRWAQQTYSDLEPHAFMEGFDGEDYFGDEGDKFYETAYAAGQKAAQLLPVAPLPEDFV